MPPNTVDVAMPEPQVGIQIKPEFPSPVQEKQGGYGWKICQSTMTMLAQVFVGGTVGLCVVFSFRNGVPLNATALHIVLCVIGYHLLMAEAFLCLSPNSWASSLTLVDKRRVHWVLQIAGSVLAIAGSVIMSLSKDINWNTLHGQFALVAMVFTTVSLVNGLASLYAYELRKLIPSNLSKLTHICFGTVALVAATVSLCYGYDKNSFRTWATAEMAYVSMALVAGLTFIAIVNPLITFTQKLVLSY